MVQLPEGKPFVPYRIVPDKQGFYIVPQHLLPAHPVTILDVVSHATWQNSGWIAGDDDQNIGHVIHKIIFLLREYGAWAGLSKDHLLKKLRSDSRGPLRSVLHLFNSFLDSLEHEGWVKLINKEDGQPVIYLTEKLILRITK